MSEDKPIDDIEDFIRENYQDIFGYLYHKVPSVQDAQDLTQETFLRFIRKVDSCDFGKKRRAYLFTIARNASIDFHRSKPAGLTPIDKDIEDLFAEKECYDNGFREIIEGLPEEAQELLSLRYAQGFGVNDIAQITGISRFSVNRKLKQALSHVKRSWEGYMP